MRSIRTTLLTALLGALVAGGLAAQDIDMEKARELFRKKKSGHLMNGANLPHPRLTKFLQNLTGSGLINKIRFDGKNTYVITERGIQYLTHYQKFADIAESFGLEL